MKNSDIINTIMFDYRNLQKEDIIKLCENLDRKILRWLGANHPDNRTRKIFFRLTNVKIGKGSVVNQYFCVSDNYLPLLTIGDRVAISPNVTVICASDPNNSLLINNKYVRDKLICEKEVIIEDDCWLGAGSIILPGIVIGKNCIIGAGSVVTENISDFAIVAGVPAKIIKFINK